MFAGGWQLFCLSVAVEFTIHFSRIPFCYAIMTQMVLSQNVLT